MILMKDTEQVILQLKPLTFIWECLIRITAGSLAILNEVYLVYLSLQEDAGVVPRLGHVQLLHWSFCHVTLYGLYAEDIIKQRNN
jgi:hypothetical protein